MYVCNGGFFIVTNVLELAILCVFDGALAEAVKLNFQSLFEVVNSGTYANKRFSDRLISQCWPIPITELPNCQ